MATIARHFLDYLIAIVNEEFRLRADCFEFVWHLMTPGSWNRFVSQLRYMALPLFVSRRDWVAALRYKPSLFSGNQRRASDLKSQLQILAPPHSVYSSNR